MEENLIQNAIRQALNCNWNEAIKINLKILESKRDDIDTLNRLAHAYFANGNVSKAKKTSQLVLKIDSYNNIAIKSLAKFRQVRKNVMTLKDHHPYTSTFIEESGKTKLTTLVNLGSEKIYTCLSAGDEVLLTPHVHKISVTTLNGDYIGKLTDDLSARLRLLIKAGNRYTVFVKSATKNCVRIFIKGDVVSFSREISETLGEFSS